MLKNKTADLNVSEIRPKICKKHQAEEKIRIVLEELRGEESIYTFPSC